MPIEDGSGLRFRFTLTPLAEIEAWSGSAGPCLHWFGLTLGEYWIEAGDAQLLRYAPEPPNEIGAGSSGRAVDCQVVRFWEDVLEWAPTVFEPVPDDFVPFVKDLGAWEATAEDDGEALDALAAIDAHALDLGYLVNPPQIWAWRGASDDLVTVAWKHKIRDGIAWAPPDTGRVQISPNGLLAAVREFHDELMAAMETRVADVVAGGLRPEIAVDLDQLQREQSDRPMWLAKRLRHSPETDWTVVRAGCRHLVRLTSD